MDVRLNKIFFNKLKLNLNLNNENIDKKLLLLYNGIIDCFSNAKMLTQAGMNELIDFFKSLFYDYQLNTDLSEHVGEF